MRTPDFFIVGAPKCGTTAMNNYLAAHPQIFMGPKEMHCFGSDLKWRKTGYDCNKYLSHFSLAKSHQKAGEASVWYLYSKTSAREIKEFNTNAKIIIMLRNPLDMLPSLHAQLIKTGEEDILGFREAMAAEHDRLLGRCLPKTDTPGLFYAILYRRVASYSVQLIRYLNVFDKENIHIILFDDLKADTRRVYRRTLEFLDVDCHFEPENFSMINIRQEPRFPTLWRAIKFAPLPLKKAWRQLLPDTWRGSILNNINRLVLVDAHTRRIDPVVRNELRMFFRPEIERLSDLLGKDLRYWLDEANDA